MFEESRGSTCSGCCFRQVFWGVAGVDLRCFYTSIVDVLLVLFWDVVWYMYSGMLQVSWGAIGVVPGCRLMQVLRGCCSGMFDTCVVRCCSGMSYEAGVVEVLHLLFWGVV